MQEDELVMSQLRFNLIFVLAVGTAFSIYAYLMHDYSVCDYNTYKDYSTTVAYQNHVLKSNAHDWCMNYFAIPIVVGGILFTLISPVVIYLHDRRKKTKELNNG